MDADANPNTPDIHGAYPIHYAVQMSAGDNQLFGDYKSGLIVLRKLLSRNAAFDVHDQDGRQPLMWAASSGSPDAIISLVNAGADVSVSDKNGLTALHCAASRGYKDCVETLVSLCEADVNKLDYNGCTALFYAVTLGHRDVTSFLLDSGSDYTVKDMKGRSTVHCGAARGQLETLKLLKSHKVNLWEKSDTGDLPLHEAINSGKKDLVRWFLNDNKKKVNAANNLGRTALHIAALNNNIEMCKILIDLKAEINPIMRNTKGHLMTPFDCASYRNYRGCAKFIQLHGGIPACKMTDKTALKYALARAISGKDFCSSNNSSSSSCSQDDNDEKEKFKEKTTTIKIRHPSKQCQNTNEKAKQAQPDSLLTVVNLKEHDEKNNHEQKIQIGVQTDQDKFHLSLIQKHSRETQTLNNSKNACINTTAITTTTNITQQNHEAINHNDYDDVSSEISEDSDDLVANKDSFYDDDNDVVVKKLPKSHFNKTKKSVTITKDSGYSDFVCNSTEEISHKEDSQSQSWKPKTKPIKKEDQIIDIKNEIHRMSHNEEEDLRLTEEGDKRRQRRHTRNSQSAKIDDNNYYSCKNSYEGIKNATNSSSFIKVPSITQTVQNSIRKYNIERQIFQELLEVKRMQIRAGRANEQVLVKRLSDNYAKIISNQVGLKRHDGPFTFKDFERYLFSQLRACQYGRPSSMSSINPRSLASQVQILIESQPKQDQLNSSNI